MKELQLSELTTEQKIGMLLTGTVSHGDEDLDYSIQMIREHKLGSIYVNIMDPKRDEIIARVREAADYPILICCDCEAGMGDYTIATPISMTAAGGDPAVAYSFGKVTGIQLRKLGYNIAYNCVVDMRKSNGVCGTTARTFGGDVEVVSRQAVAFGHGMHDSGMMACAKHLPSPNDLNTDCHMQEGISKRSRRDILSYELVPYKRMLDEGVLDAIMTTHIYMPKIDPQFPVTLSRKILDVFRGEGFNGLYITDAMTMMGIVLKYGLRECNGLAVAAGNDCVLSWGLPNKDAYESMLEAYKKGVFTDEMIDTGVTRVLNAMHRATELAEGATCTEISEEDKENFRRINEDCIHVHTAKGVSPALDKNGKHLFAVLVDMDTDLKAMVDAPIGGFFGWYNPIRIEAKIKEKFPNSDVFFLRYYPNASDNGGLLMKQIDYDDVVFVTFWSTCAYLGDECLTSRVLSLMRALQTTNRISTVVHFGNPYVMEDVPHVDRIVFGYASTRCTLHAIDVLCGDAPARGILPFKVKLQ